MVLSGELRCARQIVTVSNGEEKIIAYAKPIRGVKIFFFSVFCLFIIFGMSSKL